MFMKTALAALVGFIFGWSILTIGGCFGVPTKDDTREIATVSATALGESVAKQTAIEVKKAIEEGGLTKEKAAEIGKRIGDQASEAVLSSLENYLERRQQKDKEDGVPTPAWVGLALFVLKGLHDMKRDGILKKTPVDLNNNGIPDHLEVKK